jgi:uncharacterized protein
MCSYHRLRLREITVSRRPIRHKVTLVIYLDTCALMKLVHPEPETRALREYLRERVQVPKFTATIALAELPRAVRRANHDQAGRGSDAEAGGPFLRTLDAVHLVAAGRISATLSAFVSCDKKLAAAAQDAGLPALSPAQRADRPRRLIWPP